MASKMTILDIVAITLVIIGGLNWFFVAFGFNLVEFLIGTGFARVIYGLVGVSAMYSAVRFLFR